MANEELKRKNVEKATQTIVECMLEYGISDTTKEMVSRNSGLSLTSIARYFPTKESMVYAAVNMISEINSQKIKYNLKDAEDRNGAEHLKIFMDEVKQMYFDFPQPYILRAEVMAYSFRSSRHDADSWKMMVDSMGYRNQLKKILQKGVSDGSLICPGKNVEKEADYVADLCFGFMSNLAYSYDFSDQNEREGIKYAIGEVFDKIVKRYTA